jgi:hypothetical protein
MPPFEDEEIDGLVDEVGDMDPAPIAEPARAPVAASPVETPSPETDDGVWLGAPEGEESSSFADPSIAFGSSVSIEDLLGQEAAKPAIERPPIVPAPAWHNEPAFGSGFEIDRGFDPEWEQSSEPEPRPKAPPPAPARAAAPPAAEIPVRSPAAEITDDQPIAPFPFPTADSDDDSDRDVILTEVASGDDLFNDSSLEIARLADGDAREIVVPVMLGAGPSARRFKLAIRLRLDPVD